MLNSTKSVLNDSIIKQEGINDFTLTLCAQVDQKTYRSIDNVLNRIGGKWNSRKRKHFFKYNPLPLIEKYLDSGILPEKNPTAFFPTPLVALDVMWDRVDKSWFDYKASDTGIRVLEPSAGIGSIADFVKGKGEKVHVDTVEILPANQEILKSKGYAPFCGSFLDLPIPEKEEEMYHLILMNPPFSYTGDKHAYITHIQHAMKMLHPMGELIAIVPTGWAINKTKKEESFRNMLAEFGDATMDTLPHGTFKDSGTNVKTNVIRLSNEESWRAKPTRGCSSWHVFNFQLCATYDSFYNNIFTKLTQGFKNEEGSVTHREALQEFSLNLIRDHAKGNPSAELEGGSFISTSYLGDYVEKLVSLSYECNGTTPLVAKISSMEASFPVCSMEKKAPLSHEKQLKIIHAGGGLMDLLYAD